ncbi:MAG: hypothetical protein UHS55_06820 [Prevotella sp.]|nr:hypothetical protein [Prevotella sp.]
MSWYCLPDSYSLHTCNPETSSRVTLAPLGTVFQTAILSMLVIPRLRPGLLSLRSVLSSRQNWLLLIHICALATYSGAYPFTFTGSSVTFVLEITKLSVHLWQEQ